MPPSTESVSFNTICTLPPVGLVNLGNTCFFNSVVQALLATTELIVSPFPKSSAPVYTALLTFLNQIALSKSKSVPTTSPKTIFSAIASKYPVYKKLRQQDAHEFLRLFLGSLLEEEEANHIKHLVENTFAGRLVSHVRCKHCSHISSVIEPFLDLSLDISRTRLGNLQDMLERYFQPETFRQEALYDCEKCSKHISESPEDLADLFSRSFSLNSTCLRRAEKWYRIKSLPNVLVLHFKRFSTVGHGKFVKSNDRVSFPEILDMGPYCQEKETDLENSSTVDSDESSEESIQSDSSPTTYELYSTVVHIGSNMEAGHYVANVKIDSGDSSAWFNCNDSSVSPISLEIAMSGDAYILFYRRSIRSTE